MDNQIKNYRKALAGIILLLLFLPVILYAQQRNATLNINIMPVSPRQRSEAPVPVTVYSDWTGTAPITGSMRMEIFSDTRKICDTASKEMTISPGRQSRSMLFPSLSNNNYSTGNINLKIRFHTDKHIFTIPDQRLPLVEQNLQCFTICIASTDYVRHRKIKPGDALRIEKLSKENSKLTSFGRTGTAYISANNMPGTLPAYCAFNLVLLQADAFIDMRERQLKILKKWVFSGGSLCIIPEDEVLEDKHLEFINGLLAENLTAALPFSLTKEGNLSYPVDFPEAGPGIYRPGFGRMVIIPKKITSNDYFKSIEWRFASAFLWRVRADRCANVIREGSWLNAVEKRQNKAEPSKYATAYQNNFSGSASNDNYDSLDDNLSNNISFFMPKQFRMIPTWLLIFILLSLLLLIGPVDYIVLGKFGCRRFTWLVFPLVCIIYTSLTVFLANYYMGRRDHVGALIIVDEGVSGTVLRKTMYEVIFSGSSKVIARHCHNSFFSMQNNNRHENKAIQLDGNIFSDYNAVFYTKQWVPQINRINSFGQTKKEHEDWKFPKIWNKQTAEQFKKQTFPNNSCVSSTIVVNNDKKETKLLTPFSNESKHLLRDLISYMDAANCKDSLFAFLAGSAPSPAYGKEELIILDSTDEQETLVIVAMYDNNKRVLTIYRRLYIGVLL